MLKSIKILEVENMKLRVKYLENGKTETTEINNTAEQLELWNRQRNNEISIISVKRL